MGNQAGDLTVDGEGMKTLKLEMSAPGIYILDRLCVTGKLRTHSYTILAFSVSYLAYVGYHMCRVPLSVVESDKVFLDCSTNSTDEDPVCKSWILRMLV